MTRLSGMARPEKRAARRMHRRPKSREETPKEGSDSARRYRTATICDRAAQSARAFDSFSMQNEAARPRLGTHHFICSFNRLFCPNHKDRALRPRIILAL